MIKRWLLYFVPATIISAFSLYVVGGIGVLIGLGNGAHILESLNSISSIFYIATQIPLICFSIAGFLSSKYAKNKGLDIKKRIIFSYFWAPFFFLAYLIFIIQKPFMIFVMIWLILLVFLLMLKARNSTQFSRHKKRENI